MFNLCYILGMWVVWITAAPFLAFFSIVSAKARSFFLLRALPFGGRSAPFSKKGIWIHCASFGEVGAIAPIVEHIRRKDKPFCVSVTTKSGYEEAVRLYSGESIRVLPFENFLPFWIKRQDALIVFDAELWFALFAFAKKRGAKTMLINARIPSRSLRRYSRLRWLYKRIFKNIDFIYAQSDDDRDRLISLGAKNVSTLGNIKLLQTPQTKREFVKSSTLTIVAASTHENEEALILRAWIASGIGGRLLVVPRHVERFKTAWKEISEIAKENALSVAKFSDAGALGDAQVTLIDALGLLIDLYAIADIVALGGAFTPKGGHNPIEPARFGCKIITGEHIFHQKALFAEVSGALFSSSERLKDSFRQALSAPKPKIKGAVDREAFESALNHVCQL
ncbi:MAG: 3-deoxy-D-manno-octulosonic acid transferase [Helicobacteraceae bacterium]|jgi:3-deoxy-D-manno-octulosonic-acid transferase|nr:3-deoxy-D-manno-octulosonic acid transferase [Helicobacteraceae bacterium]